MNTIHTPVAGADWLERSICPNPSPLGRQVANLLGVVLGGMYHEREMILRKVDWTSERYISVPWGHRDLATYDDNLLTRLVVLAHDACIRLTIEPCSRVSLTLLFHPRIGPTGHTFERHPTLESAAKDVRRLYTIKDD